MIKNIKEKAKENTYFRQVLETGVHTQIVIMSIPPQGEIGEETHADNDQMLYLVEGKGMTVIEGAEMPYEKHDMLLIKAGTKHNIMNTGDEDLKIITTYSPPHHPDGTVHKTKADAENTGHPDNN